jgi:hypothetical protein
MEVLRNFVIPSWIRFFVCLHIFFNTMRNSSSQFFLKSLKLKLIIIIFIQQVLTLERTQLITITRINLLINAVLLFKEIIAVYCENHMKPINTLCIQNEELLIVKSGCLYSYHYALNS